MLPPGPRDFIFRQGAAHDHQQKTERRFNTKNHSTSLEKQELTVTYCGCYLARSDVTKTRTHARKRPRDCGGGNLSPGTEKRKRSGSAFWSQFSDSVHTAAGLPSTDPTHRRSVGGGASLSPRSTCHGACQRTRAKGGRRTCCWHGPSIAPRKVPQWVQQGGELTNPPENCR